MSYSKTKTLTISDVAAAEQEAVNKAARLGMNILLPTPYQLFIDLDSPDKHKQLADGLELLKNTKGNPAAKHWRSKSNNLHVVLTLDTPLTPDEAVRWQLVLGSDPERERWNTVKVLLGMQDFNYLFQPGNAVEIPELPADK